MVSYCATSPRSSAPWARRRATVSSMSSTANMTRCRPSVLGGGCSGSAPTAAGAWYFVSSSLLWPSRVGLIAMRPDAVESDFAPRSTACRRPEDHLYLLQQDLCLTVGPSPKLHDDRRILFVGVGRGCHTCERPGRCCR